MVIERESIKNVTVFKGKLKIAMARAIVIKENILKGFDKIVIIDNNDNEIIVNNQTVYLIDRQPLEIAG